MKNFIYHIIALNIQSGACAGPCLYISQLQRFISCLISCLYALFCRIWCFFFLPFKSLIHLFTIHIIGIWKSREQIEKRQKIKQIKSLLWRVESENGAIANENHWSPLFSEQNQFSVLGRRERVCVWVREKERKEKR